MERVILFVLSLFLQPSLPICVNSFCSANMTEFPVDNRGPRGAKFQLASSLPSSPAGFFPRP